MEKIINESIITILNELSEPIVIIDSNNKIGFANEDALNLFQVKEFNQIDIHKQVCNLTYKQIILSNGYKAYIFERKKNLHHLESTLNTFAEVSHDIKNPLHSISGFASALLEGIGGNLTDTQKKYISIISKNTNNLSLMMFNIIDISKYESCLLKLNLSDISFFEFVNTLNIKLLDYKFQNKITLKLNKDNSTTAKLNSDSLILSQLFLNIISIISNNFDKEELEINIEVMIDQFGQNKIAMYIEERYNRNNFWPNFVANNNILKGSEKLAMQACNVYLELLSLELKIEITDNHVIFYLLYR